MRYRREMPRTSSTHVATLEQARTLLNEADPEKRREFYARTELSIEVLRHLKNEVDHHKDSDSYLAMLAGERALEASGHIGDPEAVPLAAWAYATGLTVQGHFLEALRHFALGREGYLDIGREVDAARVSMREVQALAMTGDARGALELCEASRRIFAAAGMVREAAQASNNIGAIQARLGNVDEAERALEQSLAGFTTLGDDSEIAKVHINLGFSAQQNDHYRKAEEHFETALAIFQRLDQRQSAANAMVVLALLHRRTSNFSKALHLLSRSRAIYGELETRTDSAVAQLEEARIHLELNLLAEAEQHASEAIRVFAEHAMEVERVEALTVLGVARARRDQFDEALEALYEARQVWQDLDNVVEVALLDLEIAAVLFDAHVKGDGAHSELPRAYEIARLAQEALRTSESEAGQISAALLVSQLSLALDDRDGAGRQLREVEQKAVALENPSLLIQLHHLSGLLAHREEQPDVAEREYRRAVFHLESVRSTLSVDEFRSSYLGDQLTVYSDLVRLLIDQDRLDEAFGFAERGKSRALLDLLSIEGDEERTTTMPQVTALRQTLVQRRSELDRLALALETSGSSSELTAAIREVEQQVTSINRDLERLAPTATMQAGAMPTVGELTEPFSGSLVLIEYFALDDGIAAFVVEDRSVRVVRSLTTVTTIQHELERLNFFLSRVAQGGIYAKVYGPDGLQRNVDAHLGALYGQLLEPLEIATAGRTLIVVPHGPIGAVPFAGLRTPDGYLIDDAEVALVPSAAVFRHCLNAAPSDSDILEAFGVPVEDIPTVRAELDMIAELVPGSRISLGRDATVQDFVTRAPAAGILHIATHGVYRPDNPMFSGLRFADGWINARDLHALRLEADLVVLSACETGLSSFEDAGEQFGLSRSFLFSGAPTLVGSLWPVMDDKTYRLMRELYEQLMAGGTVASALRQAQLEMRSAQPNPYYWAAFTVIGDPTRRPFPST